MRNTIFEGFKARNIFLKQENLVICRYFSFYEQLKFLAQLIKAWKKFYNLGPDYRFPYSFQIKKTPAWKV